MNDRSLSSQSAAGGSIPSDIQRKLRGNKDIEKAVALRVDRNRWFIVVLALFATVIFALFEAHRANDRFANNVRVAWVKLSPNGTTQVEYEDEQRAASFFPATVDAKLIEYVERRYSKRHASIVDDLNFAYALMSDPLGTHFLREDKAQIEAAKFVKCPQCNEVKVDVRTLQSLQKIDASYLTKGHENNIFTTLAFATETERNPLGEVVGIPKNIIVTLQFRFKSKGEIIATRDQLRMNPIGMEILDESKKVDSASPAVDVTAPAQ